MAFNRSCFQNTSDVCINGARSSLVSTLKMTGSVVDVIAHLWMEAGKKVQYGIVHNNFQIKKSKMHVAPLIFTGGTTK